jgi:hypothetical protein
MSESALGQVRVIGPLAVFAAGYRAYLVEWGYSRSGAQYQLSLLVHASRWLEAEGLDLVALTSPVMLRRHVVWRREPGFRRSLSPLSLRGVVGYLTGSACWRVMRVPSRRWTSCLTRLVAICCRNAGWQPRRSEGMSESRAGSCPGAQSR